RRLLVTARGDMAGSSAQSVGGSMGKTTDAAKSTAPAQIPLAQIANVHVVEGPASIHSEGGLLRSYVQCNVRGRDIVGFVDDAKQAVAKKVKLPAGMYIEWGGQYEHQVRARQTLTFIFPLVLLAIMFLLYTTYHDMGDTLLMMLAVPGALAGGVMFQYLFGFNFSVAVWIGYIACFGMATQTGVVMLVYLREAIDNRGGLANIRSIAELREATMTGAVHRLRPKVLTEATAIIGIAPMLWATDIGAEVIRPMAAPVLGGLLIADEVIDIFLPVLFFWIRKRRWEQLQSHPAPRRTSGDRSEPQEMSAQLQPVG
ncbi:MAG TPA: efflux RND transporter permease subunit, partial [Lacipirellulaceae bacterium]|nr:efflux RND transporter permease subunit [Lacipirellulaceae bacterium]